MIIKNNIAMRAGKVSRYIAASLYQKKKKLKNNRVSSVTRLSAETSRAAAAAERTLVRQRELSDECARVQRAADEQSAAHALELHALRARSQASEDRLAGDVAAARNETGQHRAVLHKLMEENQRLTDSAQ